MEIDCVVPQALSCLVTLTTATFEWLAHTNLCSVTILSVVLYAIHVLWRREEDHILDGVILSVRLGKTASGQQSAPGWQLFTEHAVQTGSRSQLTRQFQICLNLKTKGLTSHFM